MASSGFPYRDAAAYSSDFSSSQPPLSSHFGHTSRFRVLAQLIENQSNEFYRCMTEITRTRREFMSKILDRMNRPTATQQCNCNRQLPKDDRQQTIVTLKERVRRLEVQLDATRHNQDAQKGPFGGDGELPSASSSNRRRPRRDSSSEEDLPSSGDSVPRAAPAVELGRPKSPESALQQKPPVPAAAPSKPSASLQFRGILRAAAKNAPDFFLGTQARSKSSAPLPASGLPSPQPDDLYDHALALAESFEPRADAPKPPQPRSNPSTPPSPQLDLERPNPLAPISSSGAASGHPTGSSLPSAAAPYLLRKSPGPLAAAVNASENNASHYHGLNDLLSGGDFLQLPSSNEMQRAPSPAASASVLADHNPSAAAPYLLRKSPEPLAADEQEPFESLGESLGPAASFGPSAADVLNPTGFNLPLPKPIIAARASADSALLPPLKGHQDRSAFDDFNDDLADELEALKLFSDSNQRGSFGAAAALFSSQQQPRVAQRGPAPIHQERLGSLVVKPKPGPIHQEPVDQSFSSELGRVAGLVLSLFVASVIEPRQPAQSFANLGSLPAEAAPLPSPDLSLEQYRPPAKAALQQRQSSAISLAGNSQLAAASFPPKVIQATVQILADLIPEEEKPAFRPILLDTVAGLLEAANNDLTHYIISTDTQRQIIVPLEAIRQAMRQSPQPANASAQRLVDSPAFPALTNSEKAFSELEQSWQKTLLIKDDAANALPSGNNSSSKLLALTNGEDVLPIEHSVYAAPQSEVAAENFDSESPSFGVCFALPSQEHLDSLAAQYPSPPLQAVQASSALRPLLIEAGPQIEVIEEDDIFLEAAREWRDTYGGPELALLSDDALIEHYENVKATNEELERLAREYEEFYLQSSEEDALMLKQEEIGELYDKIEPRASTNKPSSVDDSSSEVIESTEELYPSSSEEDISMLTEKEIQQLYYEAEQQASTNKTSPADDSSTRVVRSTEESDDTLLFRHLPSDQALWEKRKARLRNLERDLLDYKASLGKRGLEIS